MDAFLIFLAFVFLVTVVATSVVLFRRHQLEVRKVEIAELAERQRKEREAKKELDARVEAGTHTATGRPRCKIAGCQREAGHQRARIVQDELSLRAWVRRRFGAPRRWEPVVGGPADYCATCAVLGSQVVEQGLSQSSERITTVILEEDAGLAHLESDGVDARVAELTTQQRERASLPPSALKQVPIRRLGS